MKTWGALWVCSLFAAACSSNSADDVSQLDGGDASISKDAAAQDGATNDASTSDGSKTDGSASCGTCPTGYTCSTSNGLAVCRSNKTQIPLFTNVFVIMMEN